MGQGLPLKGYAQSYDQYDLFIFGYFTASHLAVPFDGTGRQARHFLKIMAQIIAQSYPLLHSAQVAIVTANN